MLTKFKSLSGSMILLATLVALAGCGRVSFSTLQKTEQTKGAPDDTTNHPGNNPPSNNPPGNNPPGGNPPGGNPPGGNPPVSGSYRCGGPANPADYTGYTQLVKSHARDLHNSYAACEATRQSILGGGMVCSKMVAATIAGCLQTADYKNVVFELTFALPILKATNKMESPYDYFVLGTPSCAVAASYINSNFGANYQTVGQFTSGRADISAECVAGSTKDLVIHILRIY